MKNHVLIFTALALFVIAIHAGCKPPAPENLKKATVKTNAEVWMVVTSPMIDVVSLPGTIETVNSAAVSSEIPGRVKKIHALEGAGVVKDQLLVEIDTADYELAVKQSLAQIASVEAALELANSQELRRRELLASETISREMYDAANTSVLTLTKQLEQANIGLEAAKRNLEKAKIYAPLTGIIESKQIEEGEIISPGKKLFGIIVADKVKAVVWAPERIISKIGPGNRNVSVYCNAIKQKFQGEISRIAFESDPMTRTFMTEIILNNPRITDRITVNPEYLLRIGYIVNVDFELEKIPAAVKIPIEALVLQGVRTIVFVAEEQKDPADPSKKVYTAKAKDVEVGLTALDAVQIKSGLSAGELLLVKGQRFVRDGEKIEIVKTHKSGWPW
jgi:RND family efflux transporter MFP subunit